MNFYYFKKILPLNSNKLLHLGCDAVDYDHYIVNKYPWMNIVVVDENNNNIESVQKKHINKNLSFKVEIPNNLLFRNDYFDTVIITKSLLNIDSLDQVIGEIYRVVNWGGVFINIIPNDNNNSFYNEFNNKLLQSKTLFCLKKAGFVNMTIERKDRLHKILKTFAKTSSNQVLIVKAWKGRKPISELDRVKEVMNWIYKNIKPDIQNKSRNPVNILKDGYAWCDGYSIAFQYILENENFKTRRVDLLGLHCFLEVKINGKYHLFDPTCNVYFNGYSLEELMANPDLSIPVFKNHIPDDRFQSRRYDLVCSKAAFEKSNKIHYEVKFAHYIRNLFYGIINHQWSILN